jgi:hypothetical protein
MLAMGQYYNSISIIGVWSIKANMAIHLLRDYFTQNITTSNRVYIYSYLLSLFTRRVLGYSYVGDTNYPINSVGTLLIATGDTTPTLAATFPGGNKAGINLGAQKEFYVSIPSAVRVVSGTDIGRLLVLKSAANPRFNSGIFLIAGIDTITNSYIIDYRTLGDKPPVEAADTIAWWLYEKDLSCPGQGAPNTVKLTTEYRGDGNSTTPRIILQSPHALGWQVRICNESTGDVATNTSARNCPTISVSPGFGGNSAGDFPAFGQHFHAPMWFNSSATNYLGGAPGFGDGGGTGVQFRITAVGDDTGQGVVMYGRRQNNALLPDSNIVCFGLAENETAPLPVINNARLFTIGSGFSGDDGFGSRSTNDGGLLYTSNAIAGWNVTRGTSQGMSSSSFGTPCVALPSMWTYITLAANTAGASPIFDTSATDTPYTSSTELLPIDIMQGTLPIYGGVAAQVFPFAPKNMGTIPHIREGRTNFGDFSPSTDFARSYQHLRRGLYIPWNGPNIIP